ncbi:hypothetical protein KY289_037302 [Solanum tuberosum]|nr:hypothetical protein KY289_037302 [Solanum tuberosum]
MSAILFAVAEMAAASATTLSVGSATSFDSIVSPKLQSKAFIVKYNTRNYLRNFSGLKAEAFVRCESELEMKVLQLFDNPLLLKPETKSRDLGTMFSPKHLIKWLFLEPLAV